MNTIKRLFNTQFLLLWQGQFVSRTGTNLFDIALILWIMEATGSAAVMSTILIASNIPEIFLAPFGGTLADMFSRKKILIISDLISGVLVLVFSAVLFLNVEPSLSVFILLFFVSTGLGICASCFNPTVNAVIPELVEDKQLQKANSLYQASVEGSMMIGQSLGGVLFTVIGAPVLFLVNGLSFIFSAFSEIFIKLPSDKQAGNDHSTNSMQQFKNDLKEGYRFCRKHKGLHGIFLIFALYHFFISPLTILIPFNAANTLNAGIEWTGFLLAALGGGTLAGLTVAGHLELKGDKKYRFILINIGFSAIVFIIAGLSRIPWLSLACMVLMGMVIGIIIVNLRTTMQRITPPGIRGRLFGFLNMVINGSIPIGLAFYGGLYDYLQKTLSDISIITSMIFIINGICILLMILYISINRDFKSILLLEKGTLQY